ncbi:N-Acetylglucosamine kinase [Phaffia rhodozyma]|uniref:N-Acetylglucosamine kinase n=1 Tax=Phaffia rhodozyma TaxID=264483 RepID=A0A0F7SHU7_PHARH|nr:N-Acetylglucosamine kinase [Phaffia rhodozyma]
MTALLCLAVDGGGTKSRAVISLRERQTDCLPLVVSQGIALGSNLATEGLEVCVARIKQATIRAIRSLPSSLLPSDFNEAQVRSLFHKVWIGVSGVDNAPDVELLSAHLGPYFSGACSVRITNDALLLSSPLVISDAISGVLAVSGTGTVCLSVTVDRYPGREKTISQVARRGGLGWLLGDEGSAFYVGKMALRSVLYAFDAGTLNESLHTEQEFIDELLIYWNVRSVDSLLGIVYQTLSSGSAGTAVKFKIAESARLVLKHAIPRPEFGIKKSSDLALSAVKLAAGHFAHDIARLIRPFPNGIDPNQSILCLGGSLVGQETYRQLVLESLKADHGIEFAYGCTHIADPAADAALALASL